MVFSVTMKTHEGLKLMKGPTPGQWQSWTQLEAGCRMRAALQEKDLGVTADVQHLAQHKPAMNKEEHEKQGTRVDYLTD